MTPEYIIMHHSLTKDSSTVSWGVMRKYHMEVQRWVDIGYHFGVEDVNGHPEILVGRMLNQQGAHCITMNRESLGVCVIGDYSVEAPPKDKWDLTVRLVASLSKVFHIPVHGILGHGELDEYRTCPGRGFNMNTFRDDVRKLL